MINTKVYINGEEIDLLDDISIPLTYSIADIREPEKRNTTFSKTVYLPGTQNNNQFFGQIWNVNTSINSSGTTNFNPDFNPNLKASAIITYKDSVIFTGIVQLLNISILDNYEIEYEVAFLGELGNIFQVIENRTLDEIDLSAYNHSYTYWNQSNSLDTFIIKNGVQYPFTLGEGYVYPMIDYGYNNTVDWNVKHFFPAIYLKTVVDKIINEAGFQYDSDFFNSDLFKRLVIPFSGGSGLKLTNDQIEARTFRASKTSTQSFDIYGITSTTTITITDDSTPPNFDTGGVYNTGTSKYTVPNTGTYTLYLKPKISVTHFPTSNTSLQFANTTLGWLRIFKQGYGIVASIAVSINASGTVPSGTLNVFNGGFTVTSGTTTLESEGELSINLNANAGDIFYTEFQSVINNLYNTGAPSATNFARVNINTDTSFSAHMTDPNIQEGDTVDCSAILPAKYKQSELLQSVIKAFNLFVQSDPSLPNKLYIEPRTAFYPNTADYVSDWQYKLDESKPVTITPMGELNTKRYLFTYKPDQDYFNRQYFDEYNEVYGQKILDVDNDFLKGEIKNELIFSPTPLVNTYGHDRILSKIYDVDDQGTIKPKASNIRLLYYGGVKTTNQGINITTSSGTTAVYEYGYAGHVDNPIQPTIDLSFGVPKEVFYITDYYTENNLWNVYWVDYFNELTDKNSKILTAYFHLNEVDLSELSFQDDFYIKGEFWRLNKIYDSDLESGDSIKCEFTKLKTAVPYASDTGVPIKGGLSEDGTEVPANTMRTLSNNSYGIASHGNNNYLPSIGSGIFVIGSNNSVGEGTENITITSSSGVTVLGGVRNVTLINTNDVTVTESNATYVNGVNIGSSYKKYVIHFLQTGTSNPSVTVLENTLSGTPVWTRAGVGLYDMTLTGEFLINKLYIAGFISPTGLANIPFIPISTSIYYYYLYRIDDDTIRLGIVDSSGTPVEWSTVYAGGNDYLSLPEIRIYS